MLYCTGSKGGGGSVPFGAQAYALAAVRVEHRVMAHQSSMGTKDTSRQDKACCLFPLQCLWTTAAPALVLCLKPI